MFAYILPLLMVVSCSSSSAPATCGNGVLESGEDCHDGNPTDTDGCTTACYAEAHAAGAIVLPEAYLTHRFGDFGQGAYAMLAVDANGA